MTLRYLVYCSIYFHRNDEICVVHWLLEGQKKDGLDISRYELWGKKHNFISDLIENTNCGVVAGQMQVETNSLQCVCTWRKVHVFVSV